MKEPTIIDWFIDLYYDFDHFLAKRWLDRNFGKREYWGDVINELFLGLPEKEIVVCAAVRSGDKIWRGHRHGHALQAMNDELSWDKSRKELVGESYRSEQGFITTHNRFVSREEGRALQDAAGILSADPVGYRGKTLFSEDLY